MFPAGLLRGMEAEGEVEGEGMEGSDGGFVRGEVEVRGVDG